MTPPIPQGPEYEATRALGEQFRLLGKERKQAMEAERKRERKRRRWTVFGSTGLVILVAGGTGAVATKVFVGDGGTVAVDRSAPVAELKRAPGDRRLAAAAAPDPKEDARWGLRLYTSVGGETCVVAGRVVGGRLGLLQNGQFAELPADAPGACGDLTAGGEHVFGTWRTYGTVSGARTVLYGATDRTVTALAFGRPGKFTDIPIARDGTFIVVLPGVFALRGQQFRVSSGAGDTLKPLSSG